MVGHSVLEEPLGSNLWQLERAKKLRATLGDARRFTLDALQWLIEDDVAKTVECNTGWMTSSMLGIAIAITKPDGSETRFRYAWAWDSLATVASPVQITGVP